VPEPEIVVEVLSLSTQGFDRGAKLDAYPQIASLSQYVLIVQDEIGVGVYERDDGAWRYHVLQDLDESLAAAQPWRSPRSTSGRRSPIRTYGKAADRPGCSTDRR
jgi:Uma2 family endonuclease